MFDKFRCQTQLSALRRQLGPPARRLHLAKPMKLSVRSLPNKADSVCTSRLATYPKILKAILKVL